GPRARPHARASLPCRGDERRAPTGSRAESSAARPPRASARRRRPRAPRWRSSPAPRRRGAPRRARRSDARARGTRHTGPRAGAPAGVAGGRLAALGRTAPLAHLALREPRDLDLGVVAEHRLGELELELVAQVRSAERLGATAAARAAEDVPEHIPEDVAEGVGAESAARSSRAAARLDTGVTVLIIGRPLVRVGEHLAGFLRLLEGLLRVPIVGVAVGVILHREPAVGLLDLGLSRR